jgi:hypothetical protein
MDLGGELGRCQEVLDLFTQAGYTMEPTPPNSSHQNGSSQHWQCELRFAQTYASCIDQPCMGLFFALSAAMGFVVMGADCTNAYVNSPSPTQQKIRSD